MYVHRSKHHTTLCNSEPIIQQTSNHNQFVTELPKQNTHVTFTPANNIIDHTNTIIPSTCLLKTAIAPIAANGITSTANILFDEGLQRSFISQDMVTKLQLHPATTKTLNIASFRNTEAPTQMLDMIVINVMTVTGEALPVSALVVPVIAAPLHNLCKPTIRSLPHLRGLQIANPISN